MRRSVTALLVLALVGLPVVVRPVPVVVSLAVLSALLCTAGIALLSMPIVTAGATLAAVDYVFALWIADAPLDVPTATLFGVLLFLLLAVVEFTARTRGVIVTRPALVTMGRYWLAVVAASGTVVVMLIVAAAGLGLLLRQLPYPIIVGLGAAGALLVTGAILKLIATSRDGESRKGVDDAPLA